MTSGGLFWLARHELRLSWRDWLAIMTGGQPRRLRAAVIGLVLFALFLHVLALPVVGPYAAIGDMPDKRALVVIAGSALLSWSLMLSQAMESVTRAFYARSDLELILASPLPARRIFAVRIAAIGFSIALMSLLLTGPFINVLVWHGGPRWLGAYAAVIAMAVTAAALAVALTAALFRLIGPRRTRIAAQIAAAIIGAIFVIGIQVAAIFAYGNMSRGAVLQSEALIARAPDPESIVWLPVRAALGDPLALLVVIGAAGLALGGAILVFAPRFGDYALAAASIAQAPPRPGRARLGFRRASPGRALRRKEWALLGRDPWLISQTLMQLLYLLPPALLLWRNFSGGSGALALLPPVLIMAGGQLAGGLAWLAISGEDAPDLVASAPVSPRSVLVAKVAAVLEGIAIVFAPFLLALALAAPFDAAVSAAGIVFAASSATLIQLSFRSQAKRSHFRRRHTSSRIATFAEAFSSIGWSAAGALAAAGTWLAAFPGVLAIGVVAGARLFRPARG